MLPLMVWNIKYWNQLWPLRSHEVCLLVKLSTNTTCFILHLFHSFFSPIIHSWFILLHFASLISIHSLPSLTWFFAFPWSKHVNEVRLKFCLLLHKLTRQTKAMQCWRGKFLPLYGKILQLPLFFQLDILLAKITSNVIIIHCSMEF